MSNEDKWCFAWIPPKNTAQSANRAALVKGSKWGKGNIITVSFLDGDATVQQKVQNVAEQWTGPGMANLKFSFRDDNNTLIRISFQYEGSWSVIGTECKTIVDQAEPTMNFGWLTPDSTDEDIRRVVLHEFGHAIGLIHEHQNPGSVIPWDRDAVKRNLSGPPNNWSDDVIEHNMFEPYDKAETNFTVIDPTSIMMYPIPKTWTIGGVFSAGLNDNLSARDKSFIREQYPH